MTLVHVVCSSKTANQPNKSISGQYTLMFSHTWWASRAISSASHLPVRQGTKFVALLQLERLALYHNGYHHRAGTLSESNAFPHLR